MKRILTDRIAKTVLAGCYKFGAATLLRTTGPTMSKVIEIYEDKESIRDSTDAGQAGQGRKTKSETLYDVPAHQRGRRSRICWC